MPTKEETKSVCSKCSMMQGKLCKGDKCFSLQKELEHDYDLPDKLPETYGNGRRFTADAMDCALPISLDSHSGCTFQCCYCFSNSLMRAPDRNKAAMQKIIREGSFYSEWPIDKLERLLARDLKDPVSRAMYPLLDAGMPVQCGALGDPFDGLEAHSEWTKKAIPLFIKYEQPVRFSSP